MRYEGRLPCAMKAPSRMLNGMSVKHGIEKVLVEARRSEGKAAVPDGEQRRVCVGNGATWASLRRPGVQQQ